jgi:hypothetical protein
LPVEAQDLAYALNQVVHNFGAVAVTAAGAGGRWPQRAPAAPLQRRLAWLALGGWVAQGASGATFGAISYVSSGQLPDIHGIAVAALSVKIACAALGFGLAVLYLAREPAWTDRQRQHAWSALAAFAATALGAAAFLRWFS